MGIVEEEGVISQIFYTKKQDCVAFEEKETLIIHQTAKQLFEYFEQKRRSFDFPFILHGTNFQKAVWEALLSIPYGETRSYKEIAIMIGLPKASRAVGMANQKNPLMIVFPCHRVIGSNGDLTGYAGGLCIKRYILSLEKANV